MKTMFLTILTVSVIGASVDGISKTLAQTPPQAPRREQPKPLGKPKKTDAGMVINTPVNPVDHRGSDRK